MELARVNDQVHLVTGTNVNWALVTDGDAVTLVDAGYPNDAKALFASVAAIGRRPEDVEAIVLTHAHLDHMGGIPAFRDRHDVPVLTGEEEARHARRELPIATPGHTSGHTAWLMPATGVLFTGDAFVTAHPLSRLGTRPQLLPSVFNEDESVMRRSVEAVAGLAADTIVPGHGPHQHGDLPTLVAQAVGTAP